jgi:hypothetical protein
VVPLGASEEGRGELDRGDEEELAGGEKGGEARRVNARRLGMEEEERMEEIWEGMVSARL